MQADLSAAVLNDLPEPETLAAGRGLMDGDHRRGPFGGPSKVALMLDDGGARNGHPRDGRHLVPCAIDRLPANVRGERVRRRTIKFTANWN